MFYSIHLLTLHNSKDFLLLTTGCLLNYTFSIQADSTASHLRSVSAICAAGSKNLHYLVNVLFLQFKVILLSVQLSLLSEIDM